jgi:hypothetical protein
LEIIMRINGRVLRPSTLAERRLLLGHLGVSFIRIPRSQNPYAVARRIERYLKKNEDVAFFKMLVTKRKRAVPPVTPDVDLPEPAPDSEHVAHAAE